MIDKLSETILGVVCLYWIVVGINKIGKWIYER